MQCPPLSLTIQVAEVPFLAVDGNAPFLCSFKRLNERQISGVIKGYLSGLPFRTILHALRPGHVRACEQPILFLGSAFRFLRYRLRRLFGGTV
jgi:hypothetical protein